MRKAAASLTNAEQTVRIRTLDAPNMPDVARPMVSLSARFHRRYR
jgi:hypothetical protein